MMQGLLANPAVRQAIQAAVAVGIAIEVGNLVSGRRWYWAVVTAFIVVIGVGSRWEAAVKGLQRLLGTLAGILAGMFLASAIAGHTDLAFALVLICVFVAFYAFQAAYGVMTFCITLMLAILYGLLGQFKPELLVLRLEETAAGAAVGILASALVLPVKQSVAFRHAACEFVDALSAALQACGDDDRTQSAASDLQKKVQALRNTIGGAKRGWSPFIPMSYRHAARAAMHTAYLAREILERRRMPDEQKQKLLARVQQLRDWLDAEKERKPPLESDGSPLAGEDASLANAMLDALVHLERQLAAAKLA